ncbi:MAG: metalloregulator ArsR/SmtB family transcription factor [Pseudolabrys sp.]
MPKTIPLRKDQGVCAVPCFNRGKVRETRARLAKHEVQLRTQADRYKLLGNTTRLKILLALADGELCVCDIAHVLGLGIAATSHQLKLLRGQGWLLRRDDGKMVYYSLNDNGLLDALRDDMELGSTG